MTSPIVTDLALDIHAMLSSLELSPAKDGYELAWIMAEIDEKIKQIEDLTGEKFA